MDTPPIQYARTEDGVNIAWWEVGAGPALLFLNGPSKSNSELLWAVPEAAQFFDRLASRRRLVGFDWRGTGLSDREFLDFSVDALQRDVAAVVQQAGLEQFSLLAQEYASCVGISYAAARSDQVQAVMIWNGHLAFVDSGDEAGTPLYEEGHDLWIEAILPLVLRTDATAAHIAAMQRLMRGSLDKRGRIAFSAAIRNYDVTAAAERLSQPTSIIHRRENKVHALKASQRLAAVITQAQLRVLEGRGMSPWEGDIEEAAALVEGFLDTVEPAEPMRTSVSAPVQTILFTDLESSTALTQSLGDAKAQQVLRGHNDVVRAALEAHGGEEVKHTGDGIMAAFGSTVSAVEAALQIQRALAGAEVRVRVGLNAGEPIAEDDDYFGAAVQLAARVCDRAEPGQVLVPQVVRDLCRGKTFNFEDQGEATLKGFPEPVRLFVVGEGE